MSRRRTGSMHSTDVALVALFAGAAVALLVGLVALRGCGSDVEIPPRLGFTWSVTPVWQANDPPAQRPSDTGKDLEVYLDTSQPLGGFFPPPRLAQELSGLRALGQLVQDHLVGVAGIGSSRLEWVRVAETAEPFDHTPRLERGLFKGRESRIDLALARLTRRVLEGRVAAAALITDLNQSEDVTGALGAVRAMAAWMESPRVRKGELHAALLGVRSTYWGVSGRGCPAKGDLGCWFSERRRAYFALSRPVQAPLYALIFGRGRSSVEEVADRVSRGARSLGLQPQWELLSAAAIPRRAAGNCELSSAGPERGPQFALVRKQNRGWQCVQGDQVVLSCSLPPGTALAGVRVTSSWREPASIATVIGGEADSKGSPRLVVTLDCARLREHPPIGSLALRVEGELPAHPTAAEGPWQGWTSASDEREEDLSRTPQLAYFVDRVRLRPARTVLTTGPLLELGGGPSR